MIFDSIDQLNRYAIPYAAQVIDFLNRKDLASIKEPEIEISGRDLFVRPMRYLPKSAQQNKFEAHRTYADIQVVLKGREIMQVAPGAPLKPIIEYDAVKDYQFFTVEQNISDLVVDQNHFTVFYPGEVHRPSCLAAEGDGEVFKLVFKVRMAKS